MVVTLAMNDNRENIFLRIGGILYDLGFLKGKSQPEEDTGLLGKGIGLDSIEVIQLVAALEEEFDLTIDDDDLLPEHFSSLGDLITFLEKRYLEKETLHEPV